jgi:hypothetical protein
MVVFDHQPDLPSLQDAIKLYLDVKDKPSAG